MSHPRKAQYSTRVHYWSSASGTPKPRWVRDGEVARAKWQQLTLTAAALDATDELPEPLNALREATARLRADVRTTTGLDLPLWVYGPDPEDGHYEVGPGMLVMFSPGDDLEMLLAELADEQIEEVSEALAAAHRLDEARRWPPCPAHDHSLGPAVADGTAIWRCRQDPTIRIRIGDL